MLWWTGWRPQAEVPILGQSKPVEFGIECAYLKKCHAHYQNVQKNEMGTWCGTIWFEANN